MGRGQFEINLVALHTHLENRIVEFAKVAKVVEDRASRNPRPQGDFFGAGLQLAFPDEIEAGVADGLPRPSAAVGQ